MSKKKKDKWNYGGYDPNIYNPHWQLTPTWQQTLAEDTTEDENKPKRNKKHK
jgi:hypothetical protein